ncbi:hypothetical protein B0T19DRAFT_405597 [Cercophora scortea]|uniref:Uncharacterized protein n=1 Tax=Cercophora scortea TaxID=314031 RepID=A0AAE0I2A1_9PEZI|nr:hypothetical protein B0T19DRAFT_405597 [Cercophora scortea]
MALGSALHLQGLRAGVAVAQAAAKVPSLVHACKEEFGVGEARNNTTFTNTAHIPCRDFGLSGLQYFKEVRMVVDFEYLSSAQWIWQISDDSRQLHRLGFGFVLFSISIVKNEGDFVVKSTSIGFRVVCTWGFGSIPISCLAFVPSPTAPLTIAPYLFTQLRRRLEGFTIPGEIWGPGWTGAFV